MSLLIALHILLATPIALEPYRDTVAVHANVGGHDGFFAFDTGGGISLLTPAFAEKIGCKPWGRLSGFAMMGNRIDAPRCDDVPMTIGGQKLIVPAAGVFDLMSLYAKDATPLDGSLALNMFEGKAITIDFPAKTLTVESEATLKKRMAAGTEVEARLTREAQGRALAVSVAVPTPQGKVWMELDSGNSRTILISKPYASLFGLDPDRKEPQRIDFPLAGSIRVKSDRGGFEILRQCEAIVGAGLKTSGRSELPAGSVHVTTAGTLPAKIVIHCVASDASHRSSAAIIKACVTNALLAAEAKACRSVAMPVFATGHAGFNFDRAVTIMAEALRDAHASIEDVVLVVSNAERADAARKLIANTIPGCMPVIARASSIDDEPRSLWSEES
jgi:O-acetyl-ADP-ribose deacetylase (regulator of RNase III)